MAKKAPSPRLLDEGDTIEFSLSQELPYPKGASTWVKAGATTQVRPGESNIAAKKRLVRFVEDMLEQRVQAIVE
jgi:hypothetical protein